MEEVDNNLIYFVPMITDVLIDRFVQPLSSYIALIQCKGKQKSQDINTQNDDRRDKRQKVDYTPTSVTNDAMINDWKLKDNDNCKIFAGHHVELKPKLDYRHYFRMWHIRHHCFTNCKMPLPTSQDNHSHRMSNKRCTFA